MPKEKPELVRHPLGAVVPLIDDSLVAHKLTSIDFIKNSGAFAVRVNAREKTPAGGWQPKTNDSITTDIILRDAKLAEYNQNLGVHLFGSIVDVDIDSDAPQLMDALERFLPQSNHIWGHESRPRTHRVYQLKEDFDPSEYPILRTIKKIPEVKTELRGGLPSHGQYSVVPGSIHPSGEEYRWADLRKAKSSLTVVSLDKLLEAVRLAGAVSVLVPYWIEGLRNELTMALSGFLYRTTVIADALGAEVTFQMDKEKAERFINILMEVAGDEDYRGRFKTFESTWKKAELEIPTTGASTIAKITGDALLTSKLYSLLCDSPDITVLDEFTERFAIWSGPGLIIDKDAAARGLHRPFMTRQQFGNSFGHRFVESAGKKKLVADLLFHMPTTQRLDGVTFEPGQPQIVENHVGKQINQWAGFRIPPQESFVKESLVEPFITYLHDIIASKDEEVYAWVLQWIAHIFKEPSSKVGTALVLVGLPGIGKSFLGEHFLVPMIGTHAVTTSSVDRAVNGFNALFDNKIYVQCDEAISNRQRQTAGRLKSLITDPTIVIEPKGIDPYEKPNHMRLLFTSNETRDAVFLSDGIDDRRYTVLEVSSIKKGLINEYWKPLALWAKDKNNLALVHRFLLDTDYDRAFIGTPLKTEAKFLMQEHSMPVFDAWLSSWVARDFPLSEAAHKHWYDAPGELRGEIDRSTWPNKINYSALVLDYNTILKNSRNPVIVSDERQIRVELKRRKFKTDKDPPVRISNREFDPKEGRFITSRIYLYGVPSKEDIIKYLRMKYGRGPRLTEKEPIDYEFEEKKEEEF